MSPSTSSVTFPPFSGPICFLQHCHFAHLCTYPYFPPPSFQSFFPPTFPTRTPKSIPLLVLLHPHQVPLPPLTSELGPFSPILTRTRYPRHVGEQAYPAAAATGQGQETRDGNTAGRLSGSRSAIQCISSNGTMCFHCVGGLLVPQLSFSQRLCSQSQFSIAPGGAAESGSHPPARHAAGMLGLNYCNGLTRHLQPADQELR